MTEARNRTRLLSAGTRKDERKRVLYFDACSRVAVDVGRGCAGGDLRRRFDGSPGSRQRLISATSRAPEARATGRELRIRSVHGERGAFEDCVGDDGLNASNDKALRSCSPITLPTLSLSPSPQTNLPAPCPGLVACKGARWNAPHLCGRRRDAARLPAGLRERRVRLCFSLFFPWSHTNPDLSCSFVSHRPPPPLSSSPDPPPSSSPEPPAYPTPTHKKHSPASSR